MAIAPVQEGERSYVGSSVGAVLGGGQFERTKERTFVPAQDPEFERAWEERVGVPDVQTVGQESGDGKVVEIEREEETVPAKPAKLSLGDAFNYTFVSLNWAENLYGFLKMLAPGTVLDRGWHEGGGFLYNGTHYFIKDVGVRKKVGHYFEFDEEINQWGWTAIVR